MAKSKSKAPRRTLRKLFGEETEAQKSIDPVSGAPGTGSTENTPKSDDIEAVASKSGKSSDQTGVDNSKTTDVEGAPSAATQAPKSDDLMALVNSIVDGEPTGLESSSPALDEAEEDADDKDSVDEEAEDDEDSKDSMDEAEEDDADDDEKDSVDEEAEDDEDKDEVEEAAECRDSKDNTTAAAKTLSPAAKVNVNEDVAAILSGKKFSKQFESKVKTIFEAAVTRHIDAERAVLGEAVKARLLKTEQKMIKAFALRLETALDYVVEQYLEENKVAIEKSLTVEATQKFISGLKHLFKEHYVEIPEEKVDLLGSLQEQLENVESKLNEEVSRSASMSRELKRLQKERCISEAVDGLTDVQQSKLRTLCEKVDFSDSREFGEKVKTLRESYFPTKGSSKKGPKLGELNEEAGLPQVDLPIVQGVVSALSRQVRS